MFCVKEHNGGKLDSHKWFFDAFCKRMDPHFVVVRVPCCCRAPPPRSLLVVCVLVWCCLCLFVRGGVVAWWRGGVVYQLVDVGTRPDGTAIVNLVKAMEKDARVAGCCGEIAVGLPDNQRHMMFTNAVVAAQVFEYKISVRRCAASMSFHVT